MLALVLKFLSGSVLTQISGIVQKYMDKQITEAECRAQVAETLAPELSKIAQAQADVLVAEMAGNWLQRSWRPLTALAFASIPVFYGLVTPIAVAWFNMPAPRIGDALLSWIMQAVMVCLGGYIGAKSVESVATTIGTYFGKK